MKYLIVKNKRPNYSLRYLALLFWLMFTNANAGWWEDISGWEVGDPSWRTFLTYSPRYFGPNALPAPEVTKGNLEEATHFEVSGDFHFLRGENTQNLALRYYHLFNSNKIAVEAYYVLIEKYSYSTRIRNERLSRDENGKGVAHGDLYFTTHIQLIKGRQFPNTLLRVTLKTASGSNIDAARYMDSPGYSFDISVSPDEFGKVWSTKPYLMLGFLSYQTNSDELLQNDALLYGFGVDLKRNNWLIGNSVSGYSGYMENGDKPFLYTLDVKKQRNEIFWRLRYLHGFRDWKYKTIKISMGWIF